MKRSKQARLREFSTASREQIKARDNGSERSIAKKLKELLADNKAKSIPLSGYALFSQRFEVARCD